MKKTAHGRTSAAQVGAALLMVSLGLPAMAQPISAVVRLQEKVSMEQLAFNVQNPYSPRYGHPYSPAEIRQLSAPSEQDYQNTVAQLRSEGFSIVKESPTHLWISVKADSKVYEQTFSTHIRALGRGLRRHEMEASIPGRLSLVASIHGLDNTRKAHPKHVKSNALDTKLASGPDSGVPQATIKNAYGLTPIYASGLTGAGQHIAVATYDDFSIDNVQKFYQLSKLVPGPTVDRVTFNGNPTMDENSQMETNLDAEFTGMIAPGAAIHVFTSAENSDAGELALFTAILDDNRAKVVNYSWGSCENTLTPAHHDEMAKVFARAVAQGVNLLAASGDSGSDSCQDGTTQADWPAANPNIVAIGGTSFSNDHGAMSEMGWDGSGGGISAQWDLPDWQKSLGAPYVKRSYPDVSFNADPMSGQAVLANSGGNPAWLVIGGTSMAAPQWAGYLALVNEARAKAGKGSLAFLPSLIYGFSADDRAASFNDITSGSNGAYTAAPGWDAVTGWGTMKGQALLNKLTTL